jgi:hypothetical protein
MPSPLAPTPAQIANRQLAATGAPPTNAPSGAASYSGSGLSTTSDYNDQAASELNDYLNGGTVTPAESSYENTLLGQYNANTAATESAYTNEYNGLQSDYQAQLDQLNREIGNNTNTDSENNMGVNASLLAYDKNLGASQDAQLLGSEAQAEGSNATAEANALSGLSENYQTNLTTGRSNMASELGTAATLQTPEEATAIAQKQAQNAAVVQMQTEAPDAGILSTDDFDTAISKFENSNYYKANIGTAQKTVQNLQAQIALAGAQAGEASAGAAASSASAAQTRTLTGLMTNAPAGDQMILAGLSNGTYSISDLPNLINSSVDPQGVKRITEEFLAGGGNAVQNEAQAAATKENAANVGAGGYTGAATAATNVFSNFLSGAFGSSPLSASRSLTSTPSMVIMTGPGGTYSVPSNQVSIMQKNGYTTQ